MREAIRPTVFVLATIGLAVSVALAAGGSKIEEPDTTPASPEQQANERYNQGLQYRDDAWRLQKKLDNPDTPEAKRAKIEKNIRRAYESSVRELTAAVGFKPDHHQALGSLGYAYRQLGDFENALEAYNAALELNPDYAEAIEYRGEAYLGLNRINEAQNAYRILLEKNADLAAELLGSMEAWIAARRAEPGDIAVAQLDGFARWVEDRELAACRSSLHKSRW
jgi:tetratricopeptide (TPR) repeat protein